SLLQRDITQGCRRRPLRRLSLGNLPRYPVHSYGQDKGGVWATGTTRYPPHERSSCRPKPPVHGRGWTTETARHKPCFTTCEAASPAAPRVAVPARQKQWKWPYWPRTTTNAQDALLSRSVPKPQLPIWRERD
ncbi:hypothetical protein NEUTE1DRAFT_55287, partial [Neurospora tetrasperma FGSC 2508]